VIDQWAKKDPARPALLWVNQKGEEKRFTFADLMQESDLAVKVLQNLGIHKGDRVLIMLPRIPEWWFFVIALIKLGTIYSPAPTMLTAKDISYRLTTGGFILVITNSENALKVTLAKKELRLAVSCMVVDGDLPDGISYMVKRVSLGQQSSMPGNSFPEKTKAMDPLLIFFTSGTTGYPKMVLHNHSYPLGHIVTARLWQDLKPSDLHFTISDTGWAKSAWGNLFGQWIEGVAVFVHDVRGKFDPAEIPPLLEKYQITTFCCPPTIYRMLVLLKLDRFDLSALRYCVSAGEPLNPEVIRIWKEKTGLIIHEGYGQTETVLCIGALPGRNCPPGLNGKTSARLEYRAS
jgi:acetyl-CoA synthetase